MIGSPMEVSMRLWQIEAEAGHYIWEMEKPRTSRGSRRKAVGEEKVGAKGGLGKKNLLSVML